MSGQVQGIAKQASHGQAAERGGPRFDLRFEAGNGLLSLARPLAGGIAVVEELELALSAVRFPIDLGRGAARFRHRRTRVRRAKLKIGLREVAKAAEARGVHLAFHGLAPDGAMRVSVRDEIGTLACELVPIADGTDVVLVARALRWVTEAPAPGWARLARAVRRLGADIDPALGAIRVERPLRLALSEALVLRGWRLPDDAAAAISAVRAGSGAIELEALTVGAAPEAEAERAIALLDVARWIAPVRASLEQDRIDAAHAEIDRALEALAARPGLEADPAASAAREALVELRLSLAIDRGDDARMAVPLLEAATYADEPRGACLALRLALRMNDSSAAARAALQLAAVETMEPIVVEALLAAADRVGGESPAHAAELLARAAIVAPLDAEVALRAIAAAEEARDAEAVASLGRRASLASQDADARAKIARTTAEALARLGEAGRARHLLSAALEPSGDHPALLEVLAQIAADAGEPSRAIQYLDRAAVRHEARDDRLSAARARARAARIALEIGQRGAAESRLARSASDAPEDPGPIVALAALRDEIGAAAPADEAWSMLLRSDEGGPARIDALLAAADRFFAREDASTARVFVERVARLAPHHPRLASLRSR